MAVLVRSLIAVCICEDSGLPRVLRASALIGRRPFRLTLLVSLRLDIPSKQSVCSSRIWRKNVGVVVDPGSAFNCFGNIISLLCNQPVLPGAWPSAKIIHVPPGFIEPAPPVARERWLRECNPTSYRDRVTGVTRVIYAKRGCEYGP